MRTVVPSVRSLLAALVLTASLTTPALAQTPDDEGVPEGDEELLDDAECAIACAEACEGDAECETKCALECVDAAGEPELTCPEEKVGGCDTKCASQADPDACFAQCLKDEGCIP